MRTKEQEICRDVGICLSFMADGSIHMARYCLEDAIKALDVLINEKENLPPSPNA